MNEWLKKIIEQIKTLWKKWSINQKIIILAVAGVSIVALILLFTLSSAPSRPPLFRSPITDENQLVRITNRLDEEGVDYKVENNIIYLRDEKTAMRMRSVLIREDLVPDYVDPWDVFDTDSWTITDYVRDKNFKRAIEAKLKQHIVALDDVDAVSLNLFIPDKELLEEDQDPITCSVIITPKPGSDITTNRRKIEGIEKLIMFAISGLLKENIFITDEISGIHLNDFDSDIVKEGERLEIAKKELRIKADEEKKMKAEIYKELSKIFTPDRIRIVRIDIDLDMSKKTTESEEYFPIEMRPDNPKTAWDESEYKESITRTKATENESFKGTGYNPEGPPGTEGQVPPAFKDLSSLQGTYDRSVEEVENAINSRSIKMQDRPWTIKRLTLGIAVDGRWKKMRDEVTGELMFNPDGSLQREYIEVSDEEIKTATKIIEGAVGYKRERGDIVTVEHMQFDRTAMFLQEDEMYRGQRALQRVVFWIIIGIGLIFVAIIAFRILSRYLERRRRLKEEELARQHQAMREAALRSAEEKGVEVELSVEERARLEMQENAINMAREHPEDVAQLIRTWLLEE
ncbi:MAG: flagellar M-ring protein FliF [Spirochaetales bacterium]|nr:flagellar M-ring protein FliF [Spirochaetales bacterium]